MELVSIVSLLVKLGSLIASAAKAPRRNKAKRQELAERAQRVDRVLNRYEATSSTTKGTLDALNNALQEAHEACCHDALITRFMAGPKLKDINKKINERLLEFNAANVASLKKKMINFHWHPADPNRDQKDSMKIHINCLGDGMRTTGYSSKRSRVSDRPDSLGGTNSAKSSTRKNISSWNYYKGEPQNGVYSSTNAMPPSQSTYSSSRSSSNARPPSQSTSSSSRSSSSSNATMLDHHRAQSTSSSNSRSRPPSKCTYCLREWASLRSISTTTTPMRTMPPAA